MTKAEEYLIEIRQWDEETLRALRIAECEGKIEYIEHQILFAETAIDLIEGKDGYGKVYAEIRRVEIRRFKRNLVEIQDKLKELTNGK